jgi:predicted MFS family arabinose efflux permease
MPAVVALVAGNFPPEGRPKAYGLVGAASSIAIALGPLIGGLATTYASWRWVFVGEVFVGAGIVLFARRIADAPVETRSHLDLLGSVFWLGMGLAIFGVLRSAEWGWLLAAPGAPSVLGVSPVVWLILGGLVSLWLFVLHVRRLDRAGAEPLVSPSLFGNREMTGGLLMFALQYVVMMGVFFVVPLYLSVALGLSAIDTGIRLLPISLSMVLAATCIPKFFPKASPRRVVEVGLVGIVIGIVVLFSALDVGAGAEIVTVPLLLIGLGMGALASQLGSVTVSAVPDDQSPAVGGLQNTVTQFGASLGTALAGSILITSLTASFLSGIAQNPDVPESVSSQASVELSSGVPFVSDAQLESALVKAGVDAKTTQEIVDVNEHARLDGLRSALALLAIIAMAALLFTKRIPTRQPGVEAVAHEGG